MTYYGNIRRKYFRSLRLPKDIVNEISDWRNIRRRRDLSPMRSVVFTLIWNEENGFNAKVIGDDMSDIPFIVDMNVKDDMMRDAQELMLFDWMLGKEMNSFVDNIRGKSVILAFAKKGQNRYAEEDIMVFYDFGNFGTGKIDNIKRFFGKN